MGRFLGKEGTSTLRNNVLDGHEFFSPRRHEGTKTLRNFDKSLRCKEEHEAFEEGAHGAFFFHH